MYSSPWDSIPEGLFILKKSLNGEPRLTTFYVHDISKYSVILHDCVIILLLCDRINTLVYSRL